MRRHEHPVESSQMETSYVSIRPDVQSTAPKPMNQKYFYSIRVFVYQRYSLL